MLALSISLYNLVLKPPAHRQVQSEPEAHNLTAATPKLDSIKDNNVEAIVKRQQPYLHVNEFFEISASDLKALLLPEARFMTAVWLKDQKFTDADIEPLENLVNLKLLDLEHTEVSDLHALKPLKALRILNLRDTPIHSQGMSVIGSLHNLVLLNLRHTPIADKDLKELYGLKKLRVVELAETPLVSDSSVKALEKALPECVVERMPTYGSIEWDLVFPASRLMLAEKWAQAEGELQDAIKLVEEEPEGNTRSIRAYSVIVALWKSMGDCRMAQGKTDAALISYAEAIKCGDLHNKDSQWIPEASTKLAEIYETKHNLSKAIEYRRRVDAYWNEQQAKGSQSSYAAALAQITNNLDALIVDLNSSGDLKEADEVKKELVALKAHKQKK